MVQVIANRFEVGALAGTGGIGSVYRALDRATREPVALKVLHSAIGDRDHKRFVREARILEELRHPGIVRYVAQGTEGDLRYLVMEWLDGETLAERLRRSELDVAESLEVSRSIAFALAAAHGAGLVHRDVKPSNVFLVAGKIRRVKLIDFGLARAAGPAEFTTQGQALGTPSYMAPEQARGSGWIDARADVFALGCLLFRCLAGHAPFSSNDTRQILAKALYEDAPYLGSLRRDLPQDVCELAARMLARNPDERPKDATEVLIEIDSLCGGGTRLRRRSWQAFCREQSPFVERFLLRLGVDGSRVDGLAREVIQEAQEGSGAIPADATRCTWLARIAIEILRRADLTVTVDRAKAPSTDRARTALRELDFDQRVVFILYEMDGESCEAIAAGLGLPTETVLSRLESGRSVFCDALGRALPVRGSIGS